ncbi:uncharacterized protein LOC131032140 [Cryptomeria japonica]|uniref:uncharacterized protein LOC131032140 n=1 Tax=Cryptomeria japonica TaxID=3369 RepID=UPI0025ABF52A|nr:uncharacterized protein LOC131032140 [Cryptomeria japonica]
MAAVQKKRVVIVGGGVAGANAAKALEDHADVTLIDPKEYFEVPYAKLRCMVEPGFAEKSVFLHSEYLKKAKIIVSTVTGMTKEAVTTASGEKVQYDFLVIACGTPHTGPSTTTERLKQIQSKNKKIKDAKTILIIGGGPAGVELAGEIISDFPEKKVILLHSRGRLHDILGEKSSQKSLNWLKGKNVDVHFNERIDLSNISETTTSFTTNSGKTIIADCHFICIGKKLGTSWVKDSMFQDVVDERGQIKVDKYLRVEGTTNVFAGGDIINVKELKQGNSAMMHAVLIAENIKKLSKNPNESKLGTYKPIPNIASISLGRDTANTQLPFGTFCNRFFGMLIARDLFVSRTRKGFGLKA